MPSAARGRAATRSCSGWARALSPAGCGAQGCREAYDVAVADLFQGDSTSDYLLTLEFFRDLWRGLRPGGAVIMNAFFENTDEAPNRRLLATVGAVFPSLFEFPSGVDRREAVSNGFVVATRAAAGATPVTVGGRGARRRERHRAARPRLRAPDPSGGARRVPPSPMRGTSSASSTRRRS